MDEKSKKQEHNDLKDITLDLNFVPQWARKPPGENHYRAKDYADSDRRGRRDRGDRNDRRDSRRSPRHETREGPRPGRERQPVRREPVRELPVSVSFLPEQQRLASLVRQIHHARRAYPLMELAHLFIHDAEGYLVKIEVNKGAEEFCLYQCKRCKAVACTKEMIIQHLMSSHLSDVYEKKEIETDPPAGQFVCVARCRKSGVLLGPPNHHSYTDKLNELHQTRFPQLSLDDYKRSIETVRDEELIEQWKEERRKKTVYQLRSDPEAEPVDLHKAEAEFMRVIEADYEMTHRAILPSKVAQGLDDHNITHAIRKVWSKESQFPLSMSFAMRAAFRHMHLYLFKAGKINFVTHIKPRPVRPADTVESIAEVLLFLKENPGSTRKHLLEILHPGIGPESPEAKEALQPLGWLIERGHIIEFFNGTLSVPLGGRRR
jgi:hypothetical protein